MKYNIYRFYRVKGKEAKLIKTVDSLKEAQKHCKDPLTRKEGVWFDGYQEIK